MKTRERARFGIGASSRPEQAGVCAVWSGARIEKMAKLRPTPLRTDKRESQRPKDVRMRSAWTTPTSMCEDLMRQAEALEAEGGAAAQVHV